LWRLLFAASRVQDALFLSPRRPSRTLPPSPSLLGPPASLERFGPVFLEKMAKRQQLIRLGPGPEAVALDRRWQRCVGTARVQMMQAKLPGSLVGLLRRAEQTQIAFAAAACIGPLLPGAASRAAHLKLRLDRHRAVLQKRLVDPGHSRFLTRNLPRSRLSLRHLRGRTRGPRPLE
jgi:hypothetical protein